MARKRMIDPNFWRDEKVAECTYMERLLFQGLWTFAEDSGVGRANPMLIKADVFPYDTLRASDIDKSLTKLANLGMILLYSSGEQQYYYICNFGKHQTINRPTPGLLPLPTREQLSQINDNDYVNSALTEPSLNTHGALTEHSLPNISKVNISESKLIEGNEPAHPEITMPLNTGDEYPVTQDNIDEWKKLYPSVDVMQELRNMRGWCLANPTRRKTKSGVERFIVGWLSKEQDSGKSKKPKVPEQTVNGKALGDAIMKKFMEQ